MQRRLESGAVSKDVVVAITVTAAVLGLGVFIGARSFGERTTVPQPADPVVLTPPRATPAPALHAAGLATDVERRLAAIDVSPTRLSHESRGK